MEDIKINYPKKKNAFPIVLYFNRVGKEETQVELNPGQVVYSEGGFPVTNSVRIYSRKKIITVEKEQKPGYFNFYEAYTITALNNTTSLETEKEELRDSTKLPEQNNDDSGLFFSEDMIRDSQNIMDYNELNPNVKPVVYEDVKPINEEELLSAQALQEEIDTVLSKVTKNVKQYKEKTDSKSKKGIFSKKK